MSPMLTAILAGILVWAGVSVIVAILWGGGRSWIKRRAQRLADAAETRAILTAARNWPQRRRR